MLNGLDRPKGVLIASDTTGTAVCGREDRFADRITCSDFHVYCTDPTDKIYLRVSGSGELIEDVMDCHKLLLQLPDVGQDSETGSEAKWAELQTQANVLDYTPIPGSLSEAI